MTPQFVDLTGDGRRDIVAATFMGEVFVCEGKKKGYSEPRNMLDRDGDKIRISLYWDNDKEDYLSVDRSPKGQKHDSNHHLTSVAVVDWDADGDMDLVLGAYEGALYLCKNEGTKTEPKFATTNVQIKAGNKPLTLKGGLATPRICDWNSDGKFDILCGLSDGGVVYFENIGEKTEPTFKKAKTIVARHKGSITREGENPSAPGESYHIEVVDYDEDGDLDLLVGANSTVPPRELNRTKEEQQELVKLKAEAQRIDDEMEKLYEKFEGKDEDKLYELPEFLKLEKAYDSIDDRLWELEPHQFPLDRVWLFRNSTSNSKPDAKASNAPSAKVKE